MLEPENKLRKSKIDQKTGRIVENRGKYLDFHVRKVEKQPPRNPEILELGRVMFSPKNWTRGCYLFVIFKKDNAHVGGVCVCAQNARKLRAYKEEAPWRRRANTRLGPSYVGAIYMRA